ncbi:MAG: sugar nucleotide-binding protein [Candidatus Moranbacteria bacterium]|nr:sugar nucleotide-binding protein [Candidatus Moranbacteria bacterium]MDD3964884.1 sugar nucleotide-binding protein [Candidatus Moranbacteria bacterium]
MKVTIIGTGFLGEAIYQVLKKQDIDIVTTYHTHKKFDTSLEYDFLNDDPEKVFSENKGDVVIMTAMVEFTDDSALLQKSMERFVQFFHHSRIIYISSDGIFDGERGEYTENDIPHPVTLYGKNLRICEEAVRKYSKDYCIVRPSYMYGFVNNVLDNRLKTAKELLERGETVSRFTDMYKSPLSYAEAAQVIDVLISSGYIGIVHISGERMSVYDFTKNGMKSLGISTSTLIGEPMPIPRPVGLLPDTSLRYDLMEQLTHIKPKSIQDELQV